MENNLNIYIYMNTYKNIYFYVQIIYIFVYKHICSDYFP